MKFLQITIIVVIGFVFEANAQLCGRYKTTLKITDAAGKAVTNTKIRLTPLQDENYILGGNFVREKDDASQFSISFNEGHIVKGKYKIIVSAPGFSPAEKELTFPHCAGRVFEVVLKSKGAKSGSDIQDIIRIKGEIFSQKNRLGSVELTATDSAGKIFKTKADENGHYRLELPYGDYTFIYQKAGYQTVKVVNIGIKERKNFYLYSVDIEPSKAGEKENIVEKDFKDLYKSIDVY